MRFKVKTLTHNPADDDRRRRMHEFLDKNVPKDRGEEPFPGMIDLSRSGDFIRKKRINDLNLYITNDDDEIIGALHGCGDYSSASDAIEHLGEDHTLAGELITHVLEIHQIAVHPTFRGQGLGRRLLRRAFGICKADIPVVGAQFLTFDDTEPGVRDFYVKSGFTVLETNTLHFHFVESATIYASPQHNPDYRWAVRNIRPDVVLLAGEPLTTTKTGARHDPAEESRS